MDDILTALADPARWRLVVLLAERPRSVGVLAQLADARQPQTTKHLQALERAGIASSERMGQRRIYALQPGPLREVARALGRLADDAERAGGPGSTFDRYRAQVTEERLAAHEAGWADARTFRFDRQLAAQPHDVWPHLVDPSLLVRWWTPQDLRVSHLAFDARPGGRIDHEYRDAEDADGSDVVAGRAVGTVEDVRPAERLAYRLSPLLPDGGPAFTAHVAYDLRGTPAGTALSVLWQITGSTVDSADFLAGVEIGFGQSLDRLVATFVADQSPSGTDQIRSTP